MPSPTIGEKLTPNYLELFTSKKIRRNIERKRDAMAAIGAAYSSQAQKAFRDERLGDEKWPERFPGRSDKDFINDAGALNELNRGKPVTKRKMDRRPVLRDSGTLAASIDFQPVGENKVRVYATPPADEYAGVHQWGLDDSQPITLLARDTLKEQLRELSGEKSRGGQFGAALRTLGYFFSQDELFISVAERPFLGGTIETLEETARILEEHATKDNTG